MYTNKEIISFIKENDVKFIRLTFCDMFGELKNLAIMPSEFKSSMEEGVTFNSIVLNGEHSDLLLFPDTSTLSMLPWRPQTGRVIRFFCDIKNPDHTLYEGDVRVSLRSTAEELKQFGLTCEVGTECEFYLFKKDIEGNPTKNPLDLAGYLDVAPLDKCEDIRRNICLLLDEMGFSPKSSRHKYGHGQNEINFAMSNLTSSADNMVHFRSIVKTVAAADGAFASFAPLPLENQPGSAMHINLSVKKEGKSIFNTELGGKFTAGIMKYLPEITIFLNPIQNSYERLGKNRFEIKWSERCRTSLIRIYNNMLKLQSADSTCNPYLAYKLILSAGLQGIKDDLPIIPCGVEPSKLPDSLFSALKCAKESSFVKSVLSECIRSAFWKNIEKRITDNVQDYFI